MSKSTRLEKIQFKDKAYNTIEVEVLFIGNPPKDLKLKQVIVGLTNEQALDFISRGYNVKVAEKETKFLGVVQQDHLLYLAIDIPKTFSESQIAEYRLDQHYFGLNHAIIKVAAYRWETIDGKKFSVRLYLDSLTFVDKRSGFEVLKDLEERQSWIRQKRFYNRFEQRATFWRKGDVIGMFGREYLVSHITDLGDQWGIRADLKFYESLYIRVPKQVNINL